MLLSDEFNMYNLDEIVGHILVLLSNIQLSTTQLVHTLYSIITYTYTMRKKNKKQKQPWQDKNHM